MQPLPPALDAERREYAGRAGRLACYVAGSGRPLLLIHSINAAGSAYEIKPVFDRFRDSRTVFAPDLPGFGASDRSSRAYTVQLYVDAVRDVLDQIERDHDEPVDALALSLSSEFLARAARDEPSRFGTLALITPTGFNRGADRLRAAEGSTREMRLLSAVINLPLWRRGLYALLVKPGSIRYFLRRTWGSDAIDEGLARYCDLTTHQPGAEHAPLAFLSGRLFSRDIRKVYEALDLPVWLAHGTRGDFKDFSEAGWARARDDWQVQAFDSGALPHFEHLDEFVTSYTGFLAQAGHDRRGEKPIAPGRPAQP